MIYMLNQTIMLLKMNVIKNIDANTSLEELKSKLNTNAKQFKLIKKWSRS